MLGLNDDDNNRRKNSPEFLLRCLISSIFGIFTQLSLLLIPNFFGDFSLFFQLILSGFVLMIVIIFGQFVRRFLGVRASAPAFVLFHVVFIWSVYVIVIRQAVSPPIDILFNLMLACLLVGFYRMLVSDPGFVRRDPSTSLKAPVSEDSGHAEEIESSETGRCLQNSTEAASLSSQRVKYCKSCEAHILGFDHHCPAFGNCIGQNNHALFMALLAGFIVTEALYALTAYWWTGKHKIRKGSGSMIAQSLAVSTMIFAFIQVFWEVAFFIWHIYCVCFNIRTDEWINWRRYPEFHVVIQPSKVTEPSYYSRFRTPLMDPSRQSPNELRFRNPYDKGVVSNLKDFLKRCRL